MDETKMRYLMKKFMAFFKTYRLQISIAIVLLSLASAALLLVPLAFNDLTDVDFGKVTAQLLPFTLIPSLV